MEDDHNAIDKIPTGIRGLDHVLHGGLPEARSCVIYGSAGSGKTVILNEFLYRGAVDVGAPGVFITFEESASDVRRNCETFGWDYGALIDKKLLRIVDMSPPIDDEVVVGEFDLAPIISIIKGAVQSIGAKRIAIDSIDALFGRLPDQHAVRAMLHRLISSLKDLGVTTLFSTELVGHESPHTRFGIEEFVSDGIIELATRQGQNIGIRQLEVRKMRGASYQSGTVQFSIGHDGVVVYPKIPIDMETASTDFEMRLAFGVAGLDAALGGGVPQGHMMLVAGNTGTGKSILGMHFLQEGLSNTETTVWVALEESALQVKKTSKAFGWDFAAHEREGRLRMVSASLLDIMPDKLLYDIVRAVEESGATRVVVDSISSLQSAVMGREEVRNFMIQLAGYCKMHGVTCVMNYLIAEAFGASSGQLLGSMATNKLRLSSIVDGVILLRYVERTQEVQKLITVLKLRGSAHDKGLFTYDIGAAGLNVAGRFTT